MSTATPGAPSYGHRRIIIVSDGTGETAAQMTKAAMVQFSNHDVYFTRYKNVRNEAQIRAICEDAAVRRDLMVYTIVSPQLRAYLVNLAREHSIPCIDLLGPLLIGLASYFGYEPKSIAGLLHEVNEQYFKRIEAIEYTIAHDDGRDLTGLEKADLIILGISRTSKTPLSMYLSHQGWRVCNVPLIQGFGIPEEVFKIDQRRVVGLTIDPESLATIRRARLERLGQNEGGEYADLDRVNQEIEYAGELYRQNRKWAVFNVTGKALEETASEIIKLMASRRLVPPYSMEMLPSAPPSLNGAEAPGGMSANAFAASLAAAGGNAAPEAPPPTEGAKAPASAVPAPARISAPRSAGTDGASKAGPSPVPQPRSKLNSKPKAKPRPAKAGKPAKLPKPASAVRRQKKKKP